MIIKSTNIYVKRRKKQRSKVYNYTYSLGIFSSSFFKKILDVLISAFFVLIKFIRVKIVKRVKKIVIYFKRQWFTFIDIFRKIHYTHEKNKSKYRKSSKSKYIIPLYFNLLLNIFKEFMKILRSILKLVFPVAAGYVLLLTINYFQNINLAVKVSVPSDKGGYVELGYVADESVFRIAQKTVLEDIKYEADSDELIYTTPIFTIGVVENEKIINSSQLRDGIIRAISENIEEAYGLYIDDKFYGAVKDPVNLKNTLSALKEAQATGAEDEIIDFLQEVRIEDNIYLTSGIKNEEEIIHLLTEPQEVQQQYIVKSGDTPSGVASQLGIKYEELKSLNTDITENFIPGKKLVTKGEKTFLAIKKTSTIRFEEAVAFKNLVIADNSSSVGSFKISQIGEDGLVEVKAQITMVDGVLIDQAETGRTVLKQPVDEEKMVGTRTYINGKVIYVDPNSQELGSGSFVWPTQTKGYVTNRSYAGHRAIDIQSFYGDNVVASDAGVITYVNYGRYGYGYEVVVDHLNGYQTRYAHNSKILVKQGDFVKQGQPIAQQGNTGNVRGRTGIHLHFEIIKNGVKLNPRDFV